MIDEQWLSGLKFIGPRGATVDGIAGIGSENIVFNATLPDGKRVVLKVRRYHLGFHIKELPLFLTGSPQYDIGRLNRKLLARVGDPLFDMMTSEYNRLYSSILAIMHKAKVPGLILSVMTPDSVETLPFILHTPGMQRRLRELAALTDSDEPKNPVITVNGPSFPFLGTRESIRDWAQESLESIERLWQTDPDIAPESLPENPLFVWGAAAMDGFITDDEMDDVATFVTEHYGPLASHPRAATFVSQANALANLLVQFLKENKVERFVKLCAKLGFLFQATDREGRVVADGFTELRR
ncbi:MAG: hypothetical protein AAGG50_04840 [Bacteroidota bacterium]